MINGVVCDIPTLYSLDRSIRIAPIGTPCFPEGEGGAQVLFEHEHVMNPLVKYGDSVVAGQQIAEVSDYRKDWKTKGMGIVELGVFFSNNGQPWHACPLRFIDPAIKTELMNKLNTALAAWESELQDSTLYDENSNYILCEVEEDLPDPQ